MLYCSCKLHYTKKKHGTYVKMEYMYLREIRLPYNYLILKMNCDTIFQYELWLAFRGSSNYAVLSRHPA